MSEFSIEKGTLEYHMPCLTTGKTVHIWTEFVTFFELTTRVSQLFQRKRVKYKLQI